MVFSYNICMIYVKPMEAIYNPLLECKDDFNKIKDDCYEDVIELTVAYDDMFSGKLCKDDIDRDNLETAL